MKKRALACRMHSSAPSIAYGASGLATSSEDVPARARAIPSHAHVLLRNENVTQTCAELVAPVLTHHSSESRRSDVQTIISL